MGRLFLPRFQGLLHLSPGTSVPGFLMPPLRGWNVAEASLRLVVEFQSLTTKLIADPASTLAPGAGS
jgi:hypothetical protein